MEGLPDPSSFRPPLPMRHLLRKCHLSLLHQFEQIYCLRKEPSISVSASNNLDDGSLVNGTIDGKLDDGYLITVNLGSEELKCVLYHIPTSPNISQGDSISCDAAPGFHEKYHAHEEGTGDNIGKLRSRFPDAEKVFN